MLALEPWSARKMKRVGHVLAGESSNMDSGAAAT